MNTARMSLYTSVVVMALKYNINYCSLGNPKGAILTHENVISNVSGAYVQLVSLCVCVHVCVCVCMCVCTEIQRMQ